MMQQDQVINDKCIAFIKELKAIRENKGISTYALAEMTGLKQSNISRLEGCAYMPNLLTLMRIADALGVPISVG